jgi:K+-sensing histidine kinase KdpD
MMNQETAAVFHLFISDMPGITVHPKIPCSISPVLMLYSNLAMEKGVQLHNDVPDATYLVQYRQALGVIVYNLAMNAMKYTESGEISIKALQNGDQFSLMIIDTGAGMSPQLVDMLNNGESFVLDYSTGEMKKFQFGYLIIKDLLQLIQGIMKIESTLNKGTQVTIQFNNIEM